MRQQLRQLSGDTAIYGITTIIQRFLTFFLTPFYTHLLARGELGKQATVFSTIAFLMVVAGGGMDAAFFRFASAATSEPERRPIFWNALCTSLVIAAAIALFMILAPAAFSTLTFLHLDVDSLDLVMMAGGIVFLDAASTVALASLRLDRRAKLFSMIRITAIVINIALNIWFIAGLGMGIRGVFLANLAQSAVQLLLTLPVVVRLLPVRLDRGLAREMLRFGLPTIASGLAAIALQVVDRPIMSNLIGDEAVGLYQASYRLGIVMMLLVSVFEFAWRPFFLQQASKPNARQLYARVFTYFNLAAAAIFLLVSFYIVNIATVPLPFYGKSLFAPAYWSGLGIVPIVLAAYIFNGWYTNFIVGIYVEKKTSALPWITLTAALTNALFCFILIPRFLLVGGAWATFIAYVVMAFTLQFYIRRHYAIAYEWGRVARIAIVAGALWGANVLMLDYMDTSLEAGLVRLGLLVGFPLGLYLTGFFGEDERREAGRLVAMLRRRPA